MYIMKVIRNWIHCWIWLYDMYSTYLPIVCNYKISFDCDVFIEEKCVYVCDVKNQRGFILLMFARVLNNGKFNEIVFCKCISVACSVKILYYIKCLFYICVFIVIRGYVSKKLTGWPLDKRTYVRFLRMLMIAFWNYFIVIYYFFLYFSRSSYFNTLYVY